MIEAKIKFLYPGPNRRSDWPVAEFELELEDSSIQKLESVDLRKLATQVEHIFSLQLGTAEMVRLQRANGPVEFAGLLFAVLLIRLQAMAGQQVEEYGLIGSPEDSRCVAYAAFDHADCFDEAFSLVDRMLTSLIINRLTVVCTWHFPHAIAA